MVNHRHAVAIAGQSHGRVVAALSAPEILSAGEPANGNQRFRRDPSLGSQAGIGASSIFRR